VEGYADQELLEKESPETRTEVYGYLVHRFKELEKTKGWVNASGILPRTCVWQRWLAKLLKDDGRGVKEIYKREAQRRKTEMQSSSTSADSP